MQVESVEAAALFLAVEIGDVVEADRALRALDRLGVGRVGNLMGRGERAHPVLRLAKIGEDRHDGEAEPAGHLGDAGRKNARNGDVARRRRPRLPEEERRADQQNRQRSRQRHQDKAKPRRHDAKIQCALAELIDGPFDRSLFPVLVGEKLYGRHVGQRVDDLPGDPRPRLSPRAAEAADAGQIPADQKAVADQPEAEQRGEPPVDGAEHHRRADHRGEAEGDGVGAFQRDLGDRRAGLHMLLRQSPGEVVVEEPQALPQRVAVQPGDDERKDIRPERNGVQRRR